MRELSVFHQVNSIRTRRFQSGHAGLGYEPV